MATNHLALYTGGTIGSFALTSGLLHLAQFNPWFWGLLIIYVVVVLVSGSQLRLSCGLSATRVFVVCLAGGFLFGLMGFIPTLF